MSFYRKCSSGHRSLSFAKTRSLKKSTRLLAQYDESTLRNLNRNSLCLVCRKDVRLPQQLQRAMAAEAEASREARAKVSSSKSFNDVCSLWKVRRHKS